jgi:hypothetical protein
VHVSANSDRQYKQWSSVQCDHGFSEHQCRCIQCNQYTQWQYATVPVDTTVSVVTGIGERQCQYNQWSVHTVLTFSVVSILKLHIPRSDLKKSNHPTLSDRIPGWGNADGSDGRIPIHIRWYPTLGTNINSDGWCSMGFFVVSYKALEIPMIFESRKHHKLRC